MMKHLPSTLFQLEHGVAREQHYYILDVSTRLSWPTIRHSRCILMIPICGILARMSCMSCTVMMKRCFVMTRPLH